MPVTTADDLFAAIDAGDIERVMRVSTRSLDLAATRDGDGVSAVMHALYRGQRAAAESVARAAAVRSTSSRPPASVARPTSSGSSPRTPGSPRPGPSTGSRPSTSRRSSAAGGRRRRCSRRAPTRISAPGTTSTVMPIHSAVAGRHGDVVVALLEAGADPNVRQRHGWTPLHGAAQDGDARAGRAAARRRRGSSRSQR